MKAITLHQPWATAIVLGLKQYETRPRNFKHRGPIAIHAGKKQIDPKILDQLDEIIPISHRYSWPSPDEFPLGKIVAVADIEDCSCMDQDLIDSITTLEARMGNWEPGRYAIKLTNIRPLDKPVEVSGKQGLWNFDESNLPEAIRESIR